MPLPSDRLTVESVFHQERMLRDAENLRLRASLRRIHEALGLTKPWCEKHARHNLDGALIDIERADGRADEICRRTIRRVIGQLAEVERILGCADDLR